jgi:hypothetical protein
VFGKPPAPQRDRIFNLFMNISRRNPTAIFIR